MNAFFTQWRQYWRIAEMRLLFLALLVSVIAITSVGFFTDRADKAMSGQATQLLGGDLVISSSRPISQDYLEQAEKFGLKYVEMISFPSMVSLGDKIQMAQVKAVSKNYPLVGELETSKGASKESEISNLNALQDTHIWAEPRLFTELDADTNSVVQLGKSGVKLSRQITKMPDQSASTFQFAPKLLLPLDQLVDTGLLTPASRASFSQLYVGDSTAITQFKTWLEPNLAAVEQIRTLEDGLPSVQQALNRGQRFLNMAALLSVILAGAAIALTSYSLHKRETRSVAVLKTLGASRRKILRRYLSQLFFTASLAAILGTILGYLIQLVTLYFLQDYIGQNLPHAGLLPVLSGFLTAYIMVMGFSVPQVSQLLNIAPMHILQGQRQNTSFAYQYAFVAILISTFLLMWMQTQDLQLSSFLLIGTVIAVALFWLVSTLLLKLLRGIKQSSKQSSSIALPKANTRIALLIVVFGIGLFSLLLLTTLRTDLIDRWQATLPEGAPNHFLINIQPLEQKPIKERFAKSGIDSPLYPVVRGRLTAINEKIVTANDYESERSKRLLLREFNMSATTVLPENNKTLGGEWFKSASEKGFSVESGIAETLGFKLGDTLSFDIAGQIYTDKVTSIRSVRWDNLQPNFFVLATPDAISAYPSTYMTSIYVPKEDKNFMPDLIRDYPSITDIDISSIMNQVKDIIDKAAFAVQAIFSFTLVAGIIVLFAALQSQKAERRTEIAILKSLGASHRYIRNNLLTEFALIGAIAGFVAGLLAVVASNIAAYQLFDLNPALNLTVIVVGTLAGAILVSLAAYINMRPLLNVVPMALFRSDAA